MRTFVDRFGIIIVSLIVIGVIFTTGCSEEKKVELPQVGFCYTHIESSGVYLLKSITQRANGDLYTFEWSNDPGFNYYSESLILDGQYRSIPCQVFVIEMLRTEIKQLRDDVKLLQEKSNATKR